MTKRKYREMVAAIILSVCVSMGKYEKSSVFFGLPDVGARGFAIPADDGRRWVWSC